MKIKIVARSSPLSKAQVTELYEEIKQHHPAIEFDVLYMASQGDKDLKTSLRKLEKTNFFTKELDDALLHRLCDVAVHSAKDLPDPIPEGLTIAAITCGVPSGDMLVMKDGIAIEDLPAGAIIATSSERREEAVKAMRNDLTFIDLRGTIGQRLELLQDESIYGVVVAEAALIRLNLLHLNCIPIPGPTVPLQGKLAVVTRSDHSSMLDLFACIDE